MTIRTSAGLYSLDRTIVIALWTTRASVAAVTPPKIEVFGNSLGCPQEQNLEPYQLNPIEVMPTK